MTFKFTFITFLACALMLSKSIAGAYCPYLTALKDSVARTKQGYLSAEDKIKMAEIFSPASKLTAEEKVAQSCELWWKARLAELSDSDRKLVDQFVSLHMKDQEITDAVANGDLDWSAFDYFSGEIEKFTQTSSLGISSNQTLARVMVHPSVKDTAIYSWLRTHELEHVLQAQVMSQSGLSKIGQGRVSQIMQEFGASFRQNIAEMGYMAEEGAMRAEYEFLNAVPGEEKTQLIEIVKSITGCPQDEKDFVIRVLTNSSQGPEEYLALERAAFRYDKASFEVEHIANVFNDNRGKLLLASAGVSLGTLAGVGYLGIKGFCMGEEVLKHPNQTLQKFCDHYLRE